MKSTDNVGMVAKGNKRGKIFSITAPLVVMALVCALGFLVMGGAKASGDPADKAPAPEAAAGQCPARTAHDAPTMLAQGANAEQHNVYSTVYQWASAWENNIYSIDYYKSYYHPSFWSNYKAKNGMNYSQWMADKAAKGKKAGCIQIYVDDLTVDVQGRIATAGFNQTYVSDTYCDSGRKWLYLEKFDNGWKIVGEEQPSYQKCGSRCSARGKDRQEIRVLVNQWAHAWERNVYSIDYYRSFYDPSFWSNYKSRSGMNYSQWMADKAAKGKAARCIWIMVDKLSVDMYDGWAEARFFQTYISNSYCDTGWKTLYWANIAGAWKIVGEEQSGITRCSSRCN